MKCFISLKAVKAIGILSLLLTFSVLSRAQTVPICTDFDDNDLHGFGPCPPPWDNVTVTIMAPGCGPWGGYCLRAKDESNQSLICAPPSYLGDWTGIAASECGAISFCIRLLADGCPCTHPECDDPGYITFKPHVFIYRGSIRAVFRVTNPDYFLTDPSGPSPWCKNIVAPIRYRNVSDPLHDGLPYNSWGYWEVLAPDDFNDWDYILGDVTKLAFPIDLCNSQTETMCYDNIHLRDDGCPWPILVNKDIQNRGPDAHDLAVELSGTHSICWHYDGYPSGPNQGVFSSFAWGPIVPNTKLHWQNFNDGTDNIIQTGQTIHIGWSTCGYAPIRDMYWTDATGQKLPGSKVYNITTHWHYNQVIKKFQFIWENPFPVQVSIGNVVYAVLDSAVPLEELNAENAMLTAAFSDLPGGSDFTVPVGEQVTLDIPGIVPCRTFVVIRYQSTGPGSMAACTDYMQIPPQASASEAQIPTLTEWGLIIFGVVLLGFITWVFFRRRKAVSVGG